MRSPRATRSTRALAALGAGALLLVAACGGGEESEPTRGRRDPRRHAAQRQGGRPRHLAADRSRARRRPVRRAAAPGAGAEDGQHRLERPAGGARLGRPRRRGARRGRDDPAGGVLLLHDPRRRRPRPLDAGQRHRHRLPARCRHGHQRCRGGDDLPDRVRRHRLLRRGRRRASTARAPAARRTTSSPTSARWREAAKQKKARPPDYLPVGLGRGPGAGAAGVRARRQLLRRAHHHVVVPRRPLRQRALLRRPRRRVRARQRAGAPGAGRRRRLPRPRRQLRARDRAGRQG